MQQMRDSIVDPKFFERASAPLAQSVERRPFKPVVAGSSPAGGAPPWRAKKGNKNH